MALGDWAGSVVNSTLSMTCGPAMTVVWFPVVMRLTHCTMESSMGLPSMMAETSFHSPSNSVAAADEAVGAGASLTAEADALAARALAGWAADSRTKVSSAIPLPAVEAN